MYKSRFRLKDHNVQRPPERVFINEDLTAARAALASKTRQLKKAGKIHGHLDGKRESDGEK